MEVKERVPLTLVIISHMTMPIDQESVLLSNVLWRSDSGAHLLGQWLCVANHLMGISELELWYGLSSPSTTRESPKSAYSVS